MLKSWPGLAQASSITCQDQYRLWSITVVTSGWKRHSIPSFLLCYSRLWLSLFRWRWGQTGLWPTLSDPIMSNTLTVSVCPPKYTNDIICMQSMKNESLWDNHAEIYAWTQTRAGVCLFLVLDHFFLFLAFFFFVPLSFSLTILLFSLFPPQPWQLVLMTQFFYKLFARFRPGVCQSLKGEQKHL